jgi:hypothetical protein
MRRMISAYRSLLGTHQQLVNKLKAVSEDEKNALKPAIKALEEQMIVMAEKIAEEAGRRYPAYNKIVDVLGIRENTGAMEALAEVFVYTQWCSWRRIRNYFGLWPRGKKTHYHKSKTARQALERLAISIKRTQPNSRDLDEVLKTVWIALKAQRTGPPA